ncbi:MAG: RnfH family protein [Pseudomonadota bacterium]
MNVGVAFAKPTAQVWLKIVVPDGSTVRDVIERSGLLEQFPEIDLETNKVGVFGQLAKLDKEVQEGDRVEIYRAITADPELAELTNAS